MRRRGFGLLVISMLLVASASARAAGDATAQFQALFFKKLYSYTKAGQSGRALRICVAYQPDAADTASAMQQEFQAAGVTAVLAPIDALPANLNEATAVFVLASQLPPSAKEAIARSGALSAARSVRLAEQGDVSVGMGVKDNRQPDIVIHLGRLQQEGHEVGAALLSMMRVVR